ncbi:PLP-dependent aminotransferase family protein [Kribbella sp. NPDC051718]|uniref:aminotransferase-like domain-containing protein n=1 Tax=Kribbella sp. NPDC051718 TaxID=3155168 RepID=UPI00343DD4FD
MTGLDLHLELRLDPAQPTGRALEQALREAIRSGRLATGTRLPGTRSLAGDLGVARGTVVQAYSQLVAEGWLVGLPGAGTRVAAIITTSRNSIDLRSSGVESVGGGEVLSLQAGRPDLSSFPRQVWGRAVRRVLAGATSESFDYAPPEGLPVLRNAVAEYVSRAAGLEISPLTVDASGADPDDVRGQVAVLTPAHQHPRGAVLAPERRVRFVEWAKDGFVVEDDYDGEFRYDQQPVGAMQALAPDRVIFAGCASKALAPGVRLGWLVIPPVLRKPLLQAMTSTGSGVSAIEQLVMADLITRGDYDRHIRKVRLEYRRRRTELADRVNAVWPHPLEGIAAGMHALLPLDSAEEERRLIDVAQYGGLSVHGLHGMDYWHTEDDAQPAALVLSYATPPPHAWRTALDRLTKVLQATNPSRQDG